MQVVFDRTCSHVIVLVPRVDIDIYDDRGGETLMHDAMHLRELKI